MKPASRAEIGVLPTRSSSRMRSLIRTLASTDIPMVRTMPAIPGKVRVACSSDSEAMMKARFTTSAMMANSPNKP